MIYINDVLFTEIQIVQYRRIYTVYHPPILYIIEKANC